MLKWDLQGMMPSIENDRVSPAIFDVEEVRAEPFKNRG